MIEHPAASAAEIFRTAWLIGKFHGENAATGTDRFFHNELINPSARAGITRP